MANTIATHAQVLTTAMDTAHGKMGDALNSVIICLVAYATLTLANALLLMLLLHNLHFQVANTNTIVTHAHRNGMAMDTVSGKTEDALCNVWSVRPVIVLPPLINVITNDAYQ